MVSQILTVIRLGENKNDLVASNTAIKHLKITLNSVIEELGFHCNMANNFIN